MRIIAVCLDGSGFAETALSTAFSLADRSGAMLDLVHVERSPAPTLVGPVKDRILRPAEYLADVRERLSWIDDVPVVTSTLSGEAAPALLSHFKGSRPDLVVMATHGLGPLGRFWLGSVAHEVVRSSPVPVLLVRPREGKWPTLSSGPPLNRILVPLDGSTMAEEALAPAVELAAVARAGITLLRVASRPVPVGVPLGDSMAPRSTIQEERRSAARYLRDTAARLEEAGVDVRWEARVEESPAAGILEAGRELDVDLIVATRGRGGLRRRILGSVADTVVRRAPVPVLVVQPG